VLLLLGHLRLCGEHGLDLELLLLEGEGLRVEGLLLLLLERLEHCELHLGLHGVHGERSCDAGVEVGVLVVSTACSGIG
jgi:hypothetical protein